AEEGRVRPERRQILEPQRQIAVPQDAGREALEDAVAVEELRRRLGTDSRNAWITICGVADESKKVGDQKGGHPKLLADSFRCEDLVPSAVDLHHPVLANALRHVFVRCQDADFLCSWVG